ncbi:MAG: response regulator, partial [Pseudomonadota bacterium]
MGNHSLQQETDECKVYFVDDDRGMVQSTVQWLTLSGLKVKAFADPVLLLKTIRQGEACVVVSDIRMPELDGMTLMRHIQTRDKEIPVV